MIAFLILRGGLASIQRAGNIDKNAILKRAFLGRVLETITINKMDGDRIKKLENSSESRIKAILEAIHEELAICIV